jgi:cell wall-associated NlpC family hydrolase
VIWCYRAAGAPDPNAPATTAVGPVPCWRKGKEVKVGQAAVGDIVFCGTGRSDIGHVTVYVGSGYCVSHGQESGPMPYTLGYERGSAGGLQLVKTYLP